jgi:hypothetical protein
MALKPEGEKAGAVCRLDVIFIYGCREAPLLGLTRIAPADCFSVKKF